MFQDFPWLAVAEAWASLSRSLSDASGGGGGVYPTVVCTRGPLLEGCTPPICMAHSWEPDCGWVLGLCNHIIPQLGIEWHWVGVHPSPGTGKKMGLEDMDEPFVSSLERGGALPTLHISFPLFLCPCSPATTPRPKLRKCPRTSARTALGSSIAQRVLI